MKRLHRSLCLIITGISLWVSPLSKAIETNAISGVSAKQGITQPSNTQPSVAQYLEQGETLLQAKDFPGAEAAFRQAIQLGPDTPKAHLLLGIALYEQHQIQDAKSEFQTYAALSSDPVEAHLTLGAVLTNFSNVDGAIQEYRTVLQMDPNNVNALVPLGELLAFTAREDELDAAISILEQAVRIAPANARGYAALSTSLRRQGNLDKAMQAAQRLLEIAPHSSLTHDTLGDMRLLQGQVYEAVEAYRYALHLHGSDGQPDGQPRTCVDVTSDEILFWYAGYSPDVAADVLDSLLQNPTSPLPTYPCYFSSTGPNYRKLTLETLTPEQAHSLNTTFSTFAPVTHSVEPVLGGQAATYENWSGQWKGICLGDGTATDIERQCPRSMVHEIESYRLIERDRLFTSRGWLLYQP